MTMDVDSDDSLTSYWSSGSSEPGFMDEITTGVDDFIPQRQCDVDAGRDLLRERLQSGVGRIVRDPEMITQRLRLDDVDGGFVASCRAACLLDRSRQLERLERLANRADRLQRDGDECDHRQRTERQMYPYLNDLFKFITDYHHDTRTTTSSSRGTWRCSKKQCFMGEEHTVGFPRIFPDGVALAGGCTHESFYWRDVRAFVGCGASTSDGEPSDTTSAPEVAVRGVDYARLHLSADPFRVFSVGLLVYGFHFMVAIFDHDGVCLSAPYHLRNELDVFIRVVYQIGHGLTDVELGRDPTVVPLDLPQDDSLRLALDDIVNGQVESINLRQFPSYKITLKTSDSYSLEGGKLGIETEETTWVTIGPPLWSALSYLVRGTMMWRVVALDGNRIPRPKEVLVLKNAWRRSRRDEETRVYMALRRAEEEDLHHTCRKGIANFRFGADVTFPGRVEVISTVNLRSIFLGDSATRSPVPHTSSLHRLVLETQGRPLWSFKNFKELLLGVHAAIEGHKYLVSKGIFHRDISAGTIMLSATANPSPGTEGFLTDLEYASLSTTTDISVVRSASDLEGATQTVNANRGFEMLGNIQFMAAELLGAIVYTDRKVEHEVHHDLESFAWVLAYVLARYINTQKDLPTEQRGQLKRHFTKSFGLHDVCDIHTSRLSCKPLDAKVYGGTVEAVRDTLRKRLKEDGRVVRTPGMVARRLRLESVDEAFVKACKTACLEECHEQLQTLESLALEADRKRGSSVPETGGKKAKRREKKMYSPLNDLFKFVGTYRHISQDVDVRGTCHCDAEKAIKGEEHTTGFPRIFPDGVALAHGCDHGSFYWRNVRAFIECKTSTSQGEPSRSDSVPETVVQGADYARLHLSADPFRVFSVGLLIYGFTFMVGIYDQDGVCLSAPYHLRDNLDVFIRVVYQLGHGLTDAELGRDPTVEELRLSQEDPLRLTLNGIVNERVDAVKSRTFPSYKITLKTSDTYSMEGARKRIETGETTWVTIGPPIWSSLSYLGRGSAVWRVVALEGNQIPRPREVLILKNAWRRSHRDSESRIYVALRHAEKGDKNHTYRKGIAEFRLGADVTFPGRVEAISTVNLRFLFMGSSEIPPQTPQTPVLHRLILETLGKSLWSFKDFQELLLGMRAALEGHKYLFSKGILHRDISAGNIMLSSLANPRPGMEGFLMDLEYARLDSIAEISTMKSEAKTPGATQTVFKDARRGAEMTGTLQFMAAEILEALHEETTIQHKVHHDLESFVWVLVYVTSRHLNELKDLPKKTREKLRQHFVGSFGSNKLEDILTSRLAPRLFFPPIYKELVPLPMQVLLVKLRRAVHAHFVLTSVEGQEEEVKPLTYDIVLDLFNTACRSLSPEPAVV
ncbi:hypothetical protein EYR38_005250 [Pleurotus pulmonarius]|nr:hypothetical protein EYR38_005250 [Pleurotus pulmonarius]